jgi:hypothetical protein
VSYPLLVIGLVKKQWTLVAAAAVLAFIKWTSFPAIFVILAVYLLSSKSLSELKSNLALVSLFAGVVAVLLVVPALFTQGAEEFVRGALLQELEDVPKGATLLRYVPRLVVKLLPLAALVLGAIGARRSRDQADWLVPCATGAVLLLLVYPTRAYEYGLASLLGFLPLLLWWRRQAGGEAGGIRQAMLYLYILFVSTASYSTRLFSSVYSVVELYLVVALAFLLAPVLLAFATDPRAGRGPDVRQPGHARI